MATVSRRSISVEEIRRYAGGRGDIAHLVKFLDSETESDDCYAGRGENLYNRSDLGVAGLRHQLFISDDAYIRTVFTGSYARAYTGKRFAS